MTYNYHSASKLLITVRVYPQAKKSSLELIDNSPGAVTMKAFVKSPPTEGKANHELIELFATTFKVKKKDVSIKKGFNTHNKIIEIENPDVGFLESLTSPQAKLF